MSLNMMNVHINGDRSAFLTKGSIDRFKNDLKKQTVKSISEYFNDGWNYQKSEDLNNIYITLVKEEKENNNKNNKNKILLQVRLSDLANQRKNENQLRNRLQKQKGDKKVSQELIDAYLQAKKITRNPIIDPTLVQDNLDGYWEHVNGTVQSCGNASNPFANYYRLLQSYIVTEKAKQHAIS